VEPTRLECDINDVLDKLLNKGLVLNADVIISVAGIPLLGVNLRAAIAGIETMLEYGIMEAWDKSTREWYTKEFARGTSAPLAAGEEVIIRTFGSIWNRQGIINMWKQGFLYLTNSRLFLWRKEPPEMLFEVSLDKIEGLMVKKEKHVGKEREELCLRSDRGEVARIRISNATELEQTIKMIVEQRALSCGKVEKLYQVESAFQETLSSKHCEKNIKLQPENCNVL
jgi:hypothetical protein